MNARVKKESVPKTVVATPAAAPSLADQNMAEAVLRHHAGQLDTAEALYRAVVALKSDHAEAHYHLGLIYHSQNKLPEAVVAFRDAVFARQDFAEAYASLGTVIKAQGLRDNAMIFYQQALRLSPMSAPTHSNVGVLLQDVGKMAESKEALDKSIVVSPDYVWGYLNLSACLTDLGRMEDAIASCRRGTLIDPGSAMAHYNYAAALKALNRIDESIAEFRLAADLNPEFAEAHFALGQMLLMRGDFIEGWQEYEWRWRVGEYSWLRTIHGEFAAPRWTGETLKGKTILIYAEQGMGDAIQYIRFLPKVIERAGHVVLAVHPPLKALFAQFEGVTLVSLDQVPLPPFDYHCPLLSLPVVFKTDRDTIPVAVPYLKAEPEKEKIWRERIGGKKPRVGIVWAGNPTQKGDRLRSPGLKSILPILSVPGVDFVALQMGPGRQDLEATPLPEKVLDLGAEIKDFADTAAIMADLDLLITSCTAPLHLAGALGVRTWAMIPFAPHLLWQLDRTDSPWYPSLTLYRQERPGTNWSGVAQRIKSDLAGLARR